MKPNLYVFVDMSRRNGKTIYAVIAVSKEKIEELGKRLTWVKHRRKMGRSKKRCYDAAFKRRLNKPSICNLIKDIKISTTLMI